MMASFEPTLDMTILAPRASFPKLAWLGKFDWLRMIPRQMPKIAIDFHFPPYDLESR